MQVDLSIIILNYNTRYWLKKCLDSINTFPPQKISGEIIVVDNDSHDGSVEMIKKHFPRISLIEAGENGGFAKGNNLGIANAKGRYVMLLNSDTEFVKTTNLDSMIGYLDQNHEIGVMTPKLLLADGSLDLAAHRGEPTPWAAVTYFLKLEKLFPNSKIFARYHQSWKDLDNIHQIEACSGAAMIVRREAMNEVGLLDEQFFMYAEDLDWCRRFREAGWQIVFYPRSVIIHHKYKSGRGKKESEDRFSDLAASIDTDVFLQIPGISSKAPKRKPNTTNTAEHHFWETMKQYYQKHYPKSLPGLFALRGIDIVKKLKSHSPLRS